MNQTVEKASREILKDLISQCTEPQKLLFKRMYGRGSNVSPRSLEDAEAMNILDLVDEMPIEKIDWAISQCQRTIEKNKVTA